MKFPMTITSRQVVKTIQTKNYLDYKYNRIPNYLKGTYARLRLQIKTLCNRYRSLYSLPISEQSGDRVNKI